MTVEMAKKTKLSPADKKATQEVRAYAEKCHRLGLKAQHPSLYVSWATTLCMVLDATFTSGVVAYFESREAADAAVLTVRQEARANGIAA